MDKFIVYALIAIIVSALVPFVVAKNSRHYFVTGTIILVGLIIAVLAHMNTEIRYEQYSRIDVHVENSEFRESNRDLKLYTDKGNYVLPHQNYPTSMMETVRQEGPKMQGKTAIWLASEDSIVITGIDDPKLYIDPQVTAGLESSLYKRLRNAGFGISLFGILLGCIFFVLNKRL